MNVLTSGIGEATGDYLVTCAPLQTRGAIWYVQSTTGLDGAGLGKSSDRPLATLAQAQINASAGDIIVLMSAHAETITSLTISKQLTIVGAGSVGGRPSATINGTAARIIIGAAAVELRNIYFPMSLSANTSASVEVGAFADFQATGCYFEQGANDAGAPYALYISSASATGVRLTNCSFVCTATAAATRPASAMQLNAAVVDMRMNGCVFDEGAVGWSFAAMYGPFTNVRLRIESLSLLRGAVVLLGSTTTGYINVATSTGNGRVEW
jgi:hypothetical protein